MANKYLDYAGLQRLIIQIKSLIKVTGVKGNAESSYRTGNVNLTAANVGAVASNGDTMTGNLVVPSCRAANTYYGVSFGRTTVTPVETILYTGIKWKSGSHMPVVHITGYAYGLSSPVEFKIGFYIYSDKIGWCGVTNMGSWSPKVYLFKYTNDSIDYVAIGLAGSCYFLQLSVDVQDEMGKFNNIVLDSNKWSWSFLTNSGTIPTPDGGITCIAVPYKANILNPLKVNSHTVNADVPSGAKFTDTVTTVTTSGSGNAVTSVTASNGALTVKKDTTFLTSHQDISGKADKSATVSNVTYNSTNKKITKTINGTTSDVVTVATLKTAMNLSKSDVGLGNVDNTADANKSVSHASTADSATQDAAGNVITATYVKNVNASGWIAATGITNIDEFPAESLYGIFWLNCEDSSITGAKPATVGGGILFSLRQSSGICRQFYMGVTSSAKKVRYYNYNTEAWTAWANAS